VDQIAGSLNGKTASARGSMRPRLGTLGLVLGAASLVIVGGASAGRAAPPAAPEMGRLAPDFTLPDLSGTPVRLAGFQGKKVVLINFWATWCGPCREEMSTLERLSRSRREALEVLGVNLDRGSAAKVRVFVRELGISFAILLDPDLAVARLYRVRGLPTSFVVDRDGIVRYREIGSRDWTDAESQFVLDQALRAH
jgi:peroxiredoxin